ncbi:Hypothetical protein SMAX5B_001691 [Scophthalmus maximus]|uniref:Uncharacterized protein n=1 Tax=Scophthalmus maximus TaxID=52904 RepID=A0A2U9CWI6_SCOMX|nr:Hypothetical protein SMAX5B_001691 [Scophthalmus maximus]
MSGSPRLEVKLTYRREKHASQQRTWTRCWHDPPRTVNEVVTRKPQLENIPGKLTFHSHWVMNIHRLLFFLHQYLMVLCQHQQFSVSAGTGNMFSSNCIVRTVDIIQSFKKVLSEN